MSSYKVLIAEDGKQMQNLISEALIKNGNFEVVSITNDGSQVKSLIEQFNPDLLILDIILAGKDGFSVLEEVSELKLKPKTVVLSALTQEVFITKAINLGASYYVVKPFDVNVLVNRCQEIVKQNIEASVSIVKEGINADIVSLMTSKMPKNKALEERITNIFITVGIPAHIKGYQFLREAIKMAVDSPEIINGITKKLYPSIAERFSTSASKVERAIRHAIEVAWNRGKIENINTLFGIKVYGSSDKPTNGEFIALVADKMLLEGA